MKEKIYNFLDFIIIFIIKFYRFLKRNIILIIIPFFLIIFLSYIWVLYLSKNKIYDDVNKISEKKTALILGTSKYVKGNSGLINLFYTYRLEAANELIENKKVSFLILSGTNDSKYYNEPKDMKKDLMEKGVPEDKIFLDYAGFRTLDSILRVKKIFLQDDIIIISQKFHLERALAISELNNIKAIGYVAKDPDAYILIKVYFREILSRVKFVWDTLIQKEAKFYGKKVEIK